MIIKAGYVLTYSSWENDGDYYKEHRFEGLTKEEVEDTIEFLKIFVSKNNRKSGELRTFGNSSEPISFYDIYSIYKPNFIKKLIWEEDINLVPILDKWFEDEDVFWLSEKGYTEDQLIEIIDEVCDGLIGTYLGYSEYYSARVYNDDAKVFYTPIELVLTEVTNEFK
jgi:hypothetical protein